ncbi:hypothetical protein CRENBAI_012611 [Crenichthys baileyi]|uniref:Mediator of DNA damage checkpoint protein 1 n=1 Tax=Crenichthys baileyi TaxID=28760 RepID=A0AAV9SIC2_9TELE
MTTGNRHAVLKRDHFQLKSGMDATQAISDSILESEEEENEEENQNERGKPLAKLCILRNPHIPEKELPLFLGDNVLGRDPNICTLQLLAPSVSKQHATVSISVYRRRGCDSEVDTEALVWDLGSMNGTRRGRLKLTPNVRYALSEGDGLILGNIPCRYVSSRVDSPSSLGDVGTSLGRHSEVNTRLSDSSDSKPDDVDTGSKECLKSGTKAMRTPVTGGCLSFEQTPIQPKKTLVPESDSDSESERGGRGDRKQKTIVSDSDSHKSSPSSNAFLSPPNKVVPESEDESPITPSSSNRNGSNRHVSLSLEKMDVDLGQQRLNKNNSPAFVENSEEGDEGAAKGGTYSEESGKNVKRQISKSLTEGGESPTSTSKVYRDAIPDFNLDSDTDVEGGDEEVASAGQSDQPRSTILSHMDSDTDVDEDISDKAPKTLPPTDETTKPSHVASGFQFEGMITDSDTDLEDDATVTSKAILFQGVHTADSAPPVQSGDFHLDSDTDLDEEEGGGTGAKRENPKTDEALYDKSDKPTPTAPHNLHPGSDICDEVVSDPYVAEAGRADLDILSDSDTDLEEDSHPAIPVAAAAKNLSVFSAAASGALKPDYDAPLVPQAGEEGNPVDLRMESDTDVEDEEANLGEAGEGQVPHQRRENTPGSLVPVLQNCSTPVQLSGEVEQMETQDFTSPTSDPEFCGFYAVAETQPFNLQTRDCYNGLNPNPASVLESSVVEPEDQSMRGDSFQLEVSDSSHLQGDLRALTMENTQAYVSVDVGPNLEDTQAYTEEASAENGSNLESTQPYGEDEEPARCSETSNKEGCVDLAFEATQAYISEFYDEGSDEVERQDSARTESVASLCSSTLAMAETQLMSSSVESNNIVCSLERVKTRVQNETEEHPEKRITEAQAVAQTQPIYTASDNEESDIEGMSAESLKPAAEQKHPGTSSALSLAETQAVCMSDSKESNDEGLSADSLQPAKVETRPITPSALSLAETQPLHVSSDETQPMELCEDNESNAEDSEVLRPRKRKAKQLHIDNEESQQHTNCYNQSAETQPMNSSEGDDDSDSMPSLRKKKAKPLQLEDETQSLAGSQVSAAESQPSATHEEEQSSKDFISAEKRKGNPLDIEDEQIISEAAAGLTSEDGETQPMAACKDEGLPERETKALPLPAAGVSAVEAEAEVRDRKNANESMTCARKRKSKRLHLEEEETQPITVSEVSESRRKTSEIKVLPSAKERREQTKSENDSNKDKVKGDQCRRGRRNTRKHDEEDKNRSAEIESQIKDQGDGTLRGDNEEREHVEKEELINERKAKGEQRMQETNSGSEIEDPKEPSLETAKTDQDEEPERKQEEQKHGARLEKTESKKKLLKESQENKDEEENPKGSVRVRRTARRTTAAPCEAVPDDFPARRTRSRSNSSNSVGSERSVSVVNTQESKGRGRGRGAKRSSDTFRTTAVRSSRRRTTAAAAVQDSEDQVLSASSNSSSSKMSSTIAHNKGRGRKTFANPNVVTPVIRESEQNSAAMSRKPERSSTKILQQDDKRKPDSHPSGTSRGQQPASANRAEALVLNDEGLQSNQENASADLTSPLPKRNMRGRGSKALKAEHVEEAEAPTVSDGDVARNKTQARTSEAKTKVERTQKSTEAGRKEEQKEEIPVCIQGRRTSRASSTQVKKNEESLPKKEVEDWKKVVVGAAEKRARGRTAVVLKNKNQGLEETQTSGSSMDQDGNEEASEQPLIPAMTPSRKRRVSSNSSPVAKTPRSSASPATVSRLRAGTQAYKVLFTGVVDESGERVLARLGGAMAKGVSDMNCLVTDKVRRTVKFLCAVAKGVPVVTTQWLEKSGKAGSFLSPHAFVVKDPEQEKKFSFSLQESLKNASSQPLLQGYEIHVTKSVKPEPVHMKDIITCSGATFLPKMPTAHKPRTVVISCEEDLRLCGPAMSASLLIVTAEFILTGILQQRVDFQTHALPPPVTNLQPAAGRERGRKKS